MKAINLLAKFMPKPFPFKIGVLRDDLNSNHLFFELYMVYGIQFLDMEMW